MQNFSGKFLWIALLSFMAVLVWDASGLDMAMAMLMGNTQGFPFRNSWLLTSVLHDDAKHAAWGLVVLLSASALWPWGPFAKLPFERRLQLAAVTLLATGVVSLVKATSHTSCPWDLAEFGGVARHVSHWSGWADIDGGPGRCFPAGHASAGFAFVAGYFALRRDLPRLARIWLLIALASGLALGLVQQFRGAHFMSHTLWTGWICWMTGWLTDPLFSRFRGRFDGTPA
ncbi:phosphatase PAP2 family protein [Acidovorax sp. SUPP2522]|uniref:phosphatase PAP2 family protein n=1 Tax=unclassified Acidovorax TaxID=2684926 RepID=UPI00234B2B15|nr:MULTISPECIES: phosphatase PAP2 family protein [unclassified Acidovorax]WCM96624.1 phosphatase PAP2 family protein [Acidovorax sp. GBBC 1281]GKT19280.1 phosphatase PAP2 family protein [Acidovorax sp. SUPP2522]